MSDNPPMPTIELGAAAVKAFTQVGRIKTEDGQLVLRSEDGDRPRRVIVIDRPTA